METLLIDSHCHLDLLGAIRHSGGVDAVLDQARASGVHGMLNACVSLKAYQTIRDLLRAYSGIWGSVGVHPNQRLVREPEEAELLVLAEEPKVVAIGETGLDYYRMKVGREQQQTRFRRHIAVAKAGGKPLIVHCREALADVLRILGEEEGDEIGGVIHCFVGDWDEAQYAMDFNFYISFSGIVTFENTSALQEVAVRTPLDRLLVETDCPYLTPLPERGKPNQPAFVRLVSEHVARLRGVPFAEIAIATTENFFRLFRAASPASMRIGLPPYLQPFCTTRMARSSFS